MYREPVYTIAGLEIAAGVQTKTGAVKKKPPHRGAMAVEEDGPPWRETPPIRVDNLDAWDEIFRRKNLMEDKHVAN